MRRVSRNDVFEALNRVAVSLLVPRDASELIRRINLFRIDLERAFEAYFGLVELAAALVNQSTIVMRGSVGGIQSSCLEVLLERCLCAMAAHDVHEVTAHQEEQQNQQERRAKDSREQVQRNRQ